MSTQLRTGVRSGSGTRDRQRFRPAHAMGALVVLLMVLAFLGPVTPHAFAQSDGTPDAGADATPSAESDSGRNQPASESGSSIKSPRGTDPGNPAVLAQGLAYLAGDEVVWQVQELSLPDVADAQSVTGNATLILQQQGNAVIRNDVTGKRTLLGPGQAFFQAAGDAYTISGDGGDSTAWLFEVLPADDVADNVFYESPLIDTYDEGSYDMELTRYVLPPGQDAPILDHNGPALVMSTSGDVEIEDKSGIGVLSAGQGQLTPAAATITNSSTGFIEFVVASFGESVDDTTAAPGTASDTASDGTNATDTTTTTDTTPTPVTDQTSIDTTGTTETGDTGNAANPESGFVTSINITAEIEIYVTVVADGIVVFDGTIPAGSMSGAIVGSVFEVYTSSGVNTTFTDACGNSFLMGYEEGEANYYLAADANSCAP